MELLSHYRFGDVEVNVDGDLLRVAAHRGLKIEAAQQMLELFRLMYVRHGRFFILVDLKDGGVLAPEVRRLLAKESSVYTPAAAAFFGGSLAIRASNALLMGAIKMSHSESLNTIYLPTPEAAEQWIVAMRQRLTAL